MVYTRSQKVEALNAARTLVSVQAIVDESHRVVRDSTYLRAMAAMVTSNMKFTSVSATPRITMRTPVVENRHATILRTTRWNYSEPTVAQLWSNWTTWYHTFVSEVQDEAMTSSKSHKEATTRWTSFCAKKLRCDVTYVQSWLRDTDAKALMFSAGF